jgi:hypothetical protein
MSVFVRRSVPIRQRLVIEKNKERFFAPFRMTSTTKCAGHAALRNVAAPPTLGGAFDVVPYSRRALLGAL